jgi:hypothetical protein
MLPVIAGSEFSIGVKVPRQQFTDAIDGVIGDSGQHHSQVGFWVTIVESCRTDQAVDCRRTLSSRARASEQVVLSAKSNRS